MITYTFFKELLKEAHRLNTYKIDAMETPASFMTALLANKNK